MATVVTVHGTFSTGPLEGQKWWQRGSRFATRLGELVEGLDGPLVVEPFVWNGCNSETSRHAAGARLAERLKQLDAEGEPFAVIGHSHGGSVLSTAMLNVARDRHPLRGMRRWMTVGTPFITTRRQPFLFSRLGILGRAIYLTLMTFLMLGVLMAFAGSIDSSWESRLLAVLTFTLPLAVFYAVLLYLERRRSLRFNKRHLAFAEQNFADRWLSLWHAKDEAVQCLKAVKSLDVTIFPRDFAASALNLLAIAVVPLLCLFLLNSQTAMDAIANRLFPITGPEVAEVLYPSRGASIFENASVLFVGLVLIPPSLVLPSLTIDGMPFPVQIGLLLLGIALLLGFAMLLTVIFSALARVVSHGLSLLLNPLTLAQLKAVTYGSDGREDIAIDASEWPTWLSRGFPPLPAGVADGLEAASDTAIGTAIPKFRNIIDSLTAAETAEETSDVLADYLTWQELIHTSYFDQEAFVQIVAFALCQVEGFQPTHAFIAAPGVHDTARAYAAIAEGAFVATPPA